MKIERMCVEKEEGDINEEDLYVKFCALTSAAGRAIATPL